MANNWNIPAWLEKEVRARDRACVYCGTPFTSSNVFPKSAASWEHIINDASIVTRENIARCCAACNSSKGTKDLVDWLRSKYCETHGITEDTVAEVVKEALNTAKDQTPMLREKHE